MLIAQGRVPDWVTGREAIVITTQRHKNVRYWLPPVQIPSGDDTPGHYGVLAFVETPDANWEVSVSFLRPVKPDVLEALNYIDALEFDESKDLPMKE